LKRPADIRASPGQWIGVLKVVYPYLRNQGVGDLTLFGSQAMSLYMKTPLRSKDLDLVTTRATLRQVESLADRIREEGVAEVRSTTTQTRLLGSRRMTTYSIELRLGEKPFFVEIFDRILDGRKPSILTPYVELANRWGLSLWAPSCEAIVVLRLAFRPPEGITRLNAVRLNRLIQERSRSLDFGLIQGIIREWQVEDWIRDNLERLYRVNKIRILHDLKIVPSIGEGSVTKK
jgi:hypothetical protein